MRKKSSFFQNLHALFKSLGNDLGAVLHPLGGIALGNIPAVDGLVFQFHLVGEPLDKFPLSGLVMGAVIAVRIGLAGEIGQDTATAGHTAADVTGKTNAAVEASHGLDQLGILLAHRFQHENGQNLGAEIAVTGKFHNSIHQIHSVTPFRTQTAHS